MNKETVILIIKIIVAILTAILGVLGVASFSACTMERTSDAVGRTTILIADTTWIDHRGSYQIKPSF